MARKVQVLLEDDIDGTPGAETVLFSLDGKSYEIDLSEKNADKLREAFAPWIGAGRRVSSPAAAETAPPACTPVRGHRRHPPLGSRERHPRVHPRAHLGRPAGPLRGRPLGRRADSAAPGIRLAAFAEGIAARGYGAQPGGCCLGERLLPPGAHGRGVRVRVGGCGYSFVPSRASGREVRTEWSPMFERFTDRARRVVVLAQEEARMLNHNYIGTEHILLGLIHEGEGVAAKALESMGISLESVRQQVEEIIGQGQQAPSGHIPFTPRAKKVLELSLREALQLGHNYIGTEHILLGLIREGEGVAAQVLVKLGADLNKVRQTVIQLLSGFQGKEPRPRVGHRAAGGHPVHVAGPRPVRAEPHQGRPGEQARSRSSVARRRSSG